MVKGHMKNLNKKIPNRNIFIGLIFLFFVLTASCFDTKEKEVVKYKDDTKEIYNLDKNGLIQGAIKRYYTNGKIKSEVLYEDDKKNGIEKEYYENGSLYKIGGWVNGKQMADLFEYDLKGNLISHKFYTLGEGNKFIFYREYDSIGNIINEDGSYPYWLIYNRNTFDINDTIEVVLFVSSSTDFHSIYSIDECLGSKCQSIVSKESISRPARNFLSKTKTFKKANIQKQEFSWIIKIEIFDSVTGKSNLNIDTLLFNYNSKSMSD